MEEIIIQVQDKKKAENLRDVLAALDFVTSATLKHARFPQSGAVRTQQST